MKLGNAIRTAYDRAVRSTVQIGSSKSFGAGFVVATGLLVTNHHVANLDRLNVRYFDGKQQTARVIARHRESDLALLACETGDRYPLTLSSSKDLELGDFVMAIGHPLGIENASSLGIVSFADPTTNTLLQMDLDLAPGNSGGPIIGSHGGVVGVATMIASPGIALAVRSEAIQQFLTASAGGKAGVI